MTDLLLVEKVAKAIYDATHAGLSNCYAWDDAWEDHQEARRGRYYKEARAAIATMEAHRPPVTVASLYGYEAGLVEGARLMQEAAWKAAWTAEPLPEHPLHGNDLSVFQYGKDCAMVAIRALSPPSIADDGKEGAG